MNQVLALGQLYPSRNLGDYISAVNRLPVLSQEQEQELARRFHEDGDVEAARQLVLSHLRFVVYLAREYSGYGLPQEDLIQEGNIGLMKAVKRFNPAVGVRLTSFAVHWIKAEMYEFILRNWKIVKIATTKAQRKLFFNLRSAKKRLGWLDREETQAIAADLDIRPEVVTGMEARLVAEDVHFDTPMENQEDGRLAPAHYLRDDSMDPALAAAEEERVKNRQQLLRDALFSLDERSRDIVQRRWLNEDNKVTLHELAGQYGVSAERIRQIEKNAMQKLKRQLQGKIELEAVFS